MHKISLLVPYRSDGGQRDRLWDWLEEYWESELPDAEIILGEDDGTPFSKTSAVNEAFSRSTGDIIVILDADAFLEGDVIRHCARRLRHARRNGARTWFVPYQHMFRLNKKTTEEVLESDPEDPFWPEDCEESYDVSGNGPAVANVYGALIQIMPREAFETVGGMDERFRGWGGEDVSFLRALDTLWGKHKNVPEEVFHLWHPKHQGGRMNNPWVRVWDNQLVTGPNDGLAMRYRLATWKPVMMRNLIEGGLHHDLPSEEDIEEVSEELIEHVSWPRRVARWFKWLWDN